MYLPLRGWVYGPQNDLVGHQFLGGEYGVEMEHEGMHTERGAQNSS